MKILLDENFPLALDHSLKTEGEDVEHIITLGLRGASDQHIRERLFDKDVLFLTHDEDFLFDRPTEATVVLSRVRQSRRLVERVEVWLGHFDFDDRDRVTLHLTRGRGGVAVLSTAPAGGGRSPSRSRSART